MDPPRDLTLRKIGAVVFWRSSASGGRFWGPGPSNNDSEQKFRSQGSCPDLRGPTHRKNWSAGCLGNHRSTTPMCSCGSRTSAPPILPPPSSLPFFLPFGPFLTWWSPLPIRREAGNFLIWPFFFGGGERIRNGSCGRPRTADFVRRSAPSPHPWRRWRASLAREVRGAGRQCGAGENLLSTDDRSFYFCIFLPS